MRIKKETESIWSDNLVLKAAAVCCSWNLGNASDLIEIIIFLYCFCQRNYLHKLLNTNFVYFRTNHIFSGRILLQLPADAGRTFCLWNRRRIIGCGTKYLRRLMVQGQGAEHGLRLSAEYSSSRLDVELHLDGADLRVVRTVLQPSRGARLESSRRRRLVLRHVFHLCLGKFVDL